jgi:hypothetical protein
MTWIPLPYPLWGDCFSSLENQACTEIISYLGEAVANSVALVVE